jgi:asparagine synthase (glutamine-hydrolysing)
MPGLSLLCNLVSPITDMLENLVRDRTVHGVEDLLSVLWQDPHMALLSSGYPNYPVMRYETPDYLLYVEGVIYQAPESPWQRSLLPIIADIVCDSIGGLNRAARWIEAVDGEFVIVAQDRRTNDVVILNDFLGRLPLYIHHTGELMVVSRDISIVTRLVGSVDFDRLAMAEYLLYGYPLGPRTLFRRIERVPPFAAIRIPRRLERVTVASLRVPTVTPDQEINNDSVADIAKELSAVFVRTCAARVGIAENAVLSLSGGLDSRAVAAGLVGGHVPFTAVTRGRGPSDPDVRFASRVASALQLQWKTVDFARPTGRDLLRLLRMKIGMNHLGMAFILPFFDRLKAEFGSGMVFFTGDGGDKILPDHRPTAKLPDFDALIRYVLARHGILPLATAARLSGVAQHDIVGALEDQLRSYPEDAFEDKHVHFVLFERAFKWLFEGEDRNRNFFWSTTPFYGHEPFVLAMKVPARYKANYFFYRRFMESLNDELLDVESTTVGRGLRSERISLNRVRRTLRRWSPVFVRHGWRKLTRPSAPKIVVDCIREQLPLLPATKDLRISDAEVLLARLEPTQAYMLFTLTSTIEYLTTGHSILERYQDSSYV